MVPKVLSILTLALVLVTAGCGLTIHLGGEQFKNAINGHLVLGIVTLLIALATVITVFVFK